MFPLCRPFIHTPVLLMHICSLINSSCLEDLFILCSIILEHKITCGNFVNFMQYILLYFDKGEHLAWLSFVILPTLGCLLRVIERKTLVATILVCHQLVLNPWIQRMMLRYTEDPVGLKAFCLGFEIEKSAGRWNIWKFPMVQYISMKSCLSL